MARKAEFHKGLTIFLAVLALVFGIAIGVVAGGVYDALGFESDEVSLINGEFQVHFLELGNKYTGDCTFIKAGDVDILIDAGSRASSVETISAYIDQYVTDGKLEYVIVTHAHQDHYAGFAVRNGSIFDLYEVDVIIEFALTNQKPDAKLYKDYCAERDEEVGNDGITKLYTAKQWLDEYADGSVMLGDSGVKMTVLNSVFYTEESAHENNYSVCTLFSYGSYKYLFTGDLEEDGEEKLVELNEEAISDVYLYKAGHHGSKTSSSAELLEVISPEVVCVCCCAGSPEYTKDNKNMFPTQQFIDRVAPYTDKVYVTTLCVDYEAGEYTSMNGNITVVTTANGVEVICSNDDRVLKEWEWFINNRKCPTDWKS